MQHFAILGRETLLSTAEIETVTNSSAERGEEVLLFDSDIPLPTLQARLGGTQKLGTILTLATRSSLEEKLEAELRSVQTDAKLVFGISVYALDAPKRAEELQKHIHNIGLILKKRLKRESGNAKFLTSKEKTLSSVVVKKNRLTEPGRIELVVLASKKGLYIGRTDTVQDFEDWSRRDYDRPARDARRGMLPPKLARMMVNLAGVDPQGKTLLDPFCGSGTVLMEAAILGCSKLYGSDIAKAAVRDTRKNVEWLRENGVHMPNVEIVESPAAELSLNTAVDLIVAELDLGKPRGGKETTRDLSAQLDALEILYKESFTNLRTLLKPSGVVVIAFPMHFENNKQTAADKKQDRWKRLLESCGFTVTLEPLLYRRKDQFVGRQILRARIG